MKPLGDRRVRPRFEILGAMWGTLDLDEEARVLDISSTGALIESTESATVDSMQVVRIVIAGTEIATSAYVRHVRFVADDNQHPRHLIGLELISPPVSLQYAIDQLAARTDDIG
jgi:hypothetical protein